MINETENGIYYFVEDMNSKKEHLVMLKYDGRSQTTSISCDCTLQALKIKHLPLCSHILAAMMHAGFQLGRPPKK